MSSLLWALLGLEGDEGATTFFARVREGAARRSCWGEQWMWKTSSHTRFFVVDFGHDSWQAVRCRPRASSFAEGRIGYREWVRRKGRLGDIHSLDDRVDHDIDELMA